MIVLWILLGILAALLLLLCLPVTLGVSMDFPQSSPQQQPYLTDEVKEQIAELGLCQEDEQVLCGMVQQLGSCPKPPERQITVWVRVLLLIKIPLYPTKPKPQEEKPSVQKKPSKEPQQEKPEQPKKKLGLSEMMGFAKMAMECAKRPLGMILGDICLHRLQFYQNITAEDSAQTALDAQKMVSAVYGALAVAQNVIKVKKADVRIRPVFTGGGQDDWLLRFRVSIHPIVVLAAGLRFAACFAFKMIRQMPAHTKKEKKSTDSSQDGGKDKTEQQPSTSQGNGGKEG